MSATASDRIVFKQVSKFYGEVLGVNRVDLEIPPGLTGLVGPNGSGKSTMMHLMTGLLRPSRGEITVLGLGPDQPEDLFSRVGYCTQYDSFPAGATGLSFLIASLRMHGFGREELEERAWAALHQVGLEEAAKRRIAGYSKGMRQRIKLAHAHCHDPQVLVLDEPLNGLDPMARAETIDLMRKWAGEGRHVIVSSHILHEVNVISDGVILINGGRILAEGEIRKVRGEITSQPIQVLIRSDQPNLIAAKVFALDHVVEARILHENEGLMVRTKDDKRFFSEIGQIILDSGAEVETVAPADEDVHAVYEYLIGNEGGTV
jgi:ABC-2 type transport system ATP-binding protein